MPAYAGMTDKNIHASTKVGIYHELDDLAGTWLAEDAEIFIQNSSDFKKIDQELWN